MSENSEQWLARHRAEMENIRISGERSNRVANAFLWAMFSSILALITFLLWHTFS